MSKIYTKKGDQGETCLVSGETVSKGHLRLESYGTLDELNSSLGLALSLINTSSYKKDLNQKLSEIFFEIQNDLFNIGSQLACADPHLSEKLPNIDSSDIQKLEAKIDELEADLPKLKNFILPGGSASASAFHVSRTICRRAERICIRMKEDALVDSLVIIYLNRLSDLLFVVARFCNLTEKSPEVQWKK